MASDRPAVGLPREAETSRGASPGPVPPVVVRFERWRELDGVLLPERVVAVDGRGEWVMALDSARLGLGDS